MGKKMSEKSCINCLLGWNIILALCIIASNFSDAHIREGIYFS